MSHYALLVTSPTEPTEETLAPLLQPYHEFECTGEDDQYVQTLDVTEKARARYLADTTRFYISPEGVAHLASDDRFYRDPTPEEAAQDLCGSGCRENFFYTSRDWGDGKGYRAKVHSLPEGWREEERKTADSTTFAQFLEDDGITLTVESGIDHSDKKHKYGYAIVDAAGNVLRVIDRTNPNKKWDWWTIGGRYSGKLLSLSRPGQALNICRKGDLDLDRMWSAGNKRRRASADRAAAEAKMSLDELAQTIVQLREANASWTALGDIRDYITSAPALSAFAILHRGVWHEEGTMGWWASVSNPNANWSRDCQEIIASIPDDDYIAVVDCHI